MTPEFVEKIKTAMAGKLTDGEIGALNTSVHHAKMAVEWMSIPHNERHRFLTERRPPMTGPGHDHKPPRPAEKA